MKPQLQLTNPKGLFAQWRITTWCQEAALEALRQWVNETPHDPEAPDWAWVLAGLEQLPLRPACTMSSSYNGFDPALVAYLEQPTRCFAGLDRNYVIRPSVHHSAHELPEFFEPTPQGLGWTAVAHLCADMARLTRVHDRLKAQGHWLGFAASWNQDLIKGALQHPQLIATADRLLKMTPDITIALRQPDYVSRAEVFLLYDPKDSDYMAPGGGKGPLSNAQMYVSAAAAEQRRKNKGGNYVIVTGHLTIDAVVPEPGRPQEGAALGLLGEVFAERQAEQLLQALEDTSGTTTSGRARL